MTVKNQKKTTDTKKNLPNNTNKLLSEDKTPKILNSTKKDKPFYIACLGASAGGLKAIEQFFRNCPHKTGIAYIVISHLDPTHISILPEIIQKSTKMPVLQIEDGVKVEPNCIYVIPPNNKLDIFHGTLHLTKPDNIQHHNLAIDHFLKSLAMDQCDKAICIILSGMGTDGTAGLKAIKAEFGLCLVQDPETAQSNGMPSSAVSTNLVDFILPPDEMPKELVRYINKPFLSKANKKEAVEFKSLKSLEKIFILLRSSSGHDFSNYKENTINRRIARRMSMHQISDIVLYVRYLQETPKELEILFKELLIGVTNFFRDPEAFRYLEEEILPNLINEKPDGYTIRAWVPGCSTGEEAYSIAILIRECMDKLKKNFSVQIFATDIDINAVETARKAIYPSSILEDISPERISKYFTKEKESSYQISKNIREMVIFAPQSIIKDPPFTKLDILSCRNLLIYINTAMQRKILPLFHYSLKPNGVLFLGSSETIGKFLEQFSMLDKKWKIFRRKEISGKINLEFPMHGQSIRLEHELHKKTPEKKHDIQQDIEKYLIDNHVSPCAVVDSKGDIIFIHGQTGKYFELPSGKDRKNNIFEMARKEIRQNISSSIHSVTLSNRTCVKENLQITPNGTTHYFNLTAKQLPNINAIKNLIMVMFETITPSKAFLNLQPIKQSNKKSSKEISGIEKELQYTKETLQTTIEEMESSNEELKSTNEELQSTNEELQSANEELETSKEEQQSLNEELTTVNSELQKKIDELSETSSDIKNLMNSIDIPTLFLDNNLCIKRFTEQTAELINLIPSDIGRPISHISLNLKYNNIVSDVKKVIKTLIPIKVEIETNKGLWYMMKILPYRTLLNVIDGVSISFNNITELKKTSNMYQNACLYAQSIVETVKEPLFVLDSKKKVISANRSFYEFFKVKKEETLGVSIYKLGNAQWAVPKFKKLLEEMLVDKTFIKDFEITHEFSTIGKKKILVNANKVFHEKEMILISLFEENMT